MKTQQTVKIVLMITIVLSIAMIALYFILFTAFASLRDDHVRMESNTLSSLNMKKSLEKNGEKEKALETRQNDIYNLFVKSGEEAGFIASTEALCSELALTCVMRSLDISTEEGAPTGVSLFKVTVESKGTFSNVMTLLDRFEHSRHPIKISLFDLSAERGAPVGTASNKESEWTGIFNISLPELAQ